MKPFSQLTDSEVLGLSNEDLNDSIRLEAIDRNIQPPITLSEALRRSEWRGYQKPAEAIKVFRLRQGYYVTDFGWLDEAKAVAALEGLVKIEKVNYNRDDLKISASEATVEVAWIGVSKSDDKAAKFEEFFQDNSKFIEVRDECLDRYSKVRQDAYNTRVRQEKRAEYLRLARGNEEIAKSFWAKVESGEWPAALNTEVTQ
jgi:DNA-binding Lrp family transcriptional regulator